MSEPTVQDEEKAFAEGFSGVHSQEPTLTEPDGALPADNGAPSGEGQPEAPTVLAGLTEDELKTLLAKAARVDELENQLKTRIDTVFGKIGELNRTLQQQQQSRVQLGPAALKRFSDEFGEEAAKALADDLSEAIGGGSGFSQEDVGRMFQEYAADFEARSQRDMEERFMTHLVPNWRETVSSNDWTLWLQTLPPEEAEKVINDPTALGLHQSIQRFGTWKEAGQRRQQNQSRLASAVSPQGVPSATSPKLSDHDAFVAGFRAVRGG
jgi:hypothetical protein